jgi:hydrogenase maturation factor
MYSTISIFPRTSSISPIGECRIAHLIYFVGVALAVASGGVGVAKKEGKRVPGFSSYCLEKYRRPHTNNPPTTTSAGTVSNLIIQVQYTTSIHSMCFAVPFLVMDVVKKRAVLENGDTVYLGECKAKKGDYVRVLGSIVVDVLSSKEGKQIQQTIQKLSQTL